MRLKTPASRENRASEQATHSALGLERITKVFGDLTAVNEVTLDVSDGEFFSIIGPSGCGKTTTLRIIAGLEFPTTGFVSVGGRDVTRLPAHRRPVNTVFQHYALFPHLNVFDNVAFGLREKHVPRRDIVDRVERMLSVTGLHGRGRARPRELSGGQQQRVGLARALVMEPRLLLLDEPLGALDLKLRRQMLTLLKEVQAEIGIAFVYVTHDQEEAFAMSRRVAVMNNGVVEQIAPAEIVYRCPTTLFVADFVGSANQLQGRIVAQMGGGQFSVAVKTPELEMEVAGSPGLSIGDDVAIIARPEAMSFDPSCHDSSRIPAFVTDVQYLGPQTSYRLEGPNGLPLQVLRSHDSRTRLANGDRLVVAWPHNDSWAVPL